MIEEMFVSYVRRGLVAVTLLAVGGLQADAAELKPTAAEQRLRSMLDAPLLFVKRHSYTGIHIYDTFYKWPPGGGGIYVLENPSAPRADWRIRPVIDPTTPETLGVGVYTHPELSWDARKLLFCFKGEPNGSTSIYEIGIDGNGLRRITDPTSLCACHKGGGGGLHDIAPAWLPDGRIVFLSTRPSGLVPCANSGVSILHVMNAEGSDIHPISVNNVHEFDPAVLPDGRLLFGRWEYVDKNALTIQSLWTVNPDGTQETALYANNMCLPEAILDARPVPDSHLVVGTLAKHNSTPRGSIALIDPRLGKNDPKAIINLEHPEEPTCDRGDSCEPWPLADDAVLFSGRPPGAKRNALELLDRAGHRFVLLADPDICLHSPMLVKPRPCPPIVPNQVDHTARTGRFFVQDIYRGLEGVKRGEVKWLRVLEETSRVSPTPGGNQPYNQTFLVSAALAFSVKNYLGVVPVEVDGSAYFEAPAGRAVYFQALDADGRTVQSMRTFVQAAPGTTRSCIGCHESKFGATAADAAPSERLMWPPSPLRDESWGSGYVDYPSMVQPILDEHCVECHGGRADIAAGLDLSGGWTEHFSISYENLVNRRETQLMAYWIAGIDCMNGTALWSSQLFPPRSHGSGAAPLAKLLVAGHGGRLEKLTRPERDLLMAWIDSNGLYHGTWDYSQHGCAIKSWANVGKVVAAEMHAAGCTRCHASMENDWVNLDRPELSRVLRAPLAKSNGGLGLALCRQRAVAPSQRRLRLLWNGYAHAVQPPEKFPREPLVLPDTAGDPVLTYATTADPRYQTMIELIRAARRRALAEPRVDMPGAERLPGASRQFNPPPLPAVAPALHARVGRDGAVRVSWEQSARTIGLTAELHRGEQPNFTPSDKTKLTETTLFTYSDETAPPGVAHYAVIIASDGERSRPSYATLIVPPPVPPPTPKALTARGASYSVRLQWEPPSDEVSLRYHVYRGKPNGEERMRLTVEPLALPAFIDCVGEVEQPLSYVVRAVSRRGLESPPSDAATAAATVVKEPVFAAAFDKSPRSSALHDAAPAKLQAPAVSGDGVLDTRQGGYAAFVHRGEFELNQPLTVELWVRFDRQGKMPVVVGCGQWQHAGWFLQWLGGRWRWHVGGVDCDGGQPELDRWMHLVATYDGRACGVFQDGKQVAEAKGAVNAAPWPGDLIVGQYSGQNSPDYQAFGRIAGLKLYHRPLSAAEIAAAARTPPE